MDCDATHHSTNGRGWDVRGGLGSACELPCTATGRGQAPEARTEARFTSECPALPQGGGKPHKRERKRFRSGPPPHHHRAGASPAPTLHGLRRPFRRIVGATLAVALRWGPCCNLPYVRAYGGKPRPYYTRAWQANLAGYVSLLVYFQSGL